MICELYLITEPSLIANCKPVTVILSSQEIFPLPESIYVSKHRTIADLAFHLFGDTKLFWIDRIALLNL